MNWKFWERKTASACPHLVEVGEFVAIDPRIVATVYLKKREQELIVRVSRSSAFTLRPDDVFDGDLQLAYDLIVGAQA